MIQAYVAKKAYETLTGSGRRQEESVAEYKRRIRRRRTSVGTVALMASLGIFAGAHNVKEDRIDYSVEAGGEAKVTYIDRDYSKISVIAFEALVDGVKTKAIETNRPLGDAVVLDLWRELALSNYGVTGSLCMDAGSLRVAKIEEPNGYTHFRAEVNPERDMYVCSHENKNITPTETIDGSVNALIKDGLTNVERTWNKTSDEAKKVNAIWATLGQAARTAAEITVNKECGPLVFDATKDDAKRLIADGLRRDDSEVIEVVYTVNANGEVKLTGQSDLDATIEQRKAEGIKFTDGSGKCTLPASVAGGGDERAKRS